MVDNKSTTVQFKKSHQPFNEDDFIARTRTMVKRLGEDQDPKRLRQTYWTESERKIYNEIEETPLDKNIVKRIVDNKDLFVSLVQYIVEDPKDMVEWFNNNLILACFQQGHLIPIKELQDLGDEQARDNMFFHQCEEISNSLKNPKFVKKVLTELDARSKRDAFKVISNKPKPPSQ